VEFGASTFVIPERIEPVYIDRFRAAGVACLEIGQRPVFVDPDDAEQHARIREHLALTGCRIHSIHAGHTLQHTMSHPDPDIRNETVRQARLAARIVVALGGDVVVVHPGGGTRDIDDMTGFLTRVRKGMPRIAEAVVEEGARVAVENANPNGFPMEPERLMEIVTAFPPEHVGVCIDTGHANFAGYTTEVIDAAAGRILTTHLHDNHGALDEHLPPGQGTIDWHATMSAFHAAGYTGPWIFECGLAGEPPFADLPASMALLTDAWRNAADTR
jgi:sugar phosphate isomerase/epimerase